MPKSLLLEAVHKACSSKLGQTLLFLLNYIVAERSACNPLFAAVQKQMMLVEWHYRPGVISKLTYMGGHSPHREGNGIAHHIGQEHLAAVTCFDPAEREDYTTIWHLARHEQQFAVTTRANGVSSQWCPAAHMCT